MSQTCLLQPTNLSTSPASVPRSSEPATTREQRSIQGPHWLGGALSTLLTEVGRTWTSRSEGGWRRGGRAESGEPKQAAAMQLDYATPSLMPVHPLSPPSLEAENTSNVDQHIINQTYNKGPPYRSYKL